MSLSTEDCSYIEVGYSFNTRTGKEFHRGDYIPYWRLPVFCKSRNGYSAFNSAYRYSDTNVDSAALYGGLYLDLDDDNNFENVRQDALTVISYMKIVYSIKPDDMEIYFSGKKGVHIIIPPEIMDIQPSKDLNLVFRHIAESVKNYTPNKTVDMKIYDNKRLFRIPNTIHESTGLYKIRITAHELRTLSKDDIYELAKSPRKFKRKQALKNIHASEQFIRAVKETQEELKRAGNDFRKVSTINFIPPCIQNILDKGADVGFRNQTIACLATFYKQYGASLHEAYDIITEWNSKNTVPTPVGELKRTVKSLYVSDKAYGCQTFKSLSICDSSNCKIGKRKEYNNAHKDTKNKRNGGHSNKGKPPSSRI